jgi:hypothetical protein
VFVAHVSFPGPDKGGRHTRPEQGITHKLMSAAYSRHASSRVWAARRSSGSRPPTVSRCDCASPTCIEKRSQSGVPSASMRVVI